MAMNATRVVRCGQCLRVGLTEHTTVLRRTPYFVLLINCSHFFAYTVDVWLSIIVVRSNVTRESEQSPNTISYLKLYYKSDKNPSAT